TRREDTGSGKREERAARAPGHNPPAGRGSKGARRGRAKGAHGAGGETAGGQDGPPAAATEASDRDGADRG
ncbi:acetate kinase, partial [Mycobacterium tuberculosis]